MMKSKYTAATALLVWLLVTGWLATLVIAKPAVLRQSPTQEDTARMAELRAAIANNQSSQQLLASLASTGTQGSIGPVVALPALASVANATAGDAGLASASVQAGDDQVVPAPRLSAVIQTDGQRSAIIDGQVVRIGSRLSDGSRVRAIGHDWVRAQYAAGSSYVLRVRSIATAGEAS